MSTELSWADMLWGGRPINHDHAFNRIKDSEIGMFWIILCPAVNIFLALLFRALGWWPDNSRNGSRKSDVMAFEITAFMCVCYVAYYGILAYVGWGDEPNIYDDLTNHADGKYAVSKYVEDKFIFPMLGYQIWNFFACFLLVEFRSVSMVGHHVATGFLAYLGLEGGYLHRECLFYFGLAEFTNVPLTFVDVFKYFKEYITEYSHDESGEKRKNPQYSTFCVALEDYSSKIFGISFIALRLIMWPIVTYYFWVSSMDLLQTGKANPPSAVLAFLVCNVFLTGLQFMWGDIIVRRVLCKFGVLEPPKKEGNVSSTATTRVTRSNSGKTPNKK